MKPVMSAIKKVVDEFKCHHKWRIRIGVQYMDYAPYSFYECEKCHKKKAYR